MIVPEMHPIRLAACLTALSAGVWLFAQSRAPLPAVVVEGVIRDAETRAPIPNARVTVRGEHRAVSGGDGRFEFKVQPPETVIVHAELEGYSNLADMALVIEGDKPGYRVDLRMIKPAEIRGILVDEDTGKPVPNLRVVAERGVYLAGRLRFGTPNAIVQETSKSDGSFHLEKVIAGEYILRLESVPATAIEPLPISSNAVKEGPLSYGTVIWPGKNADYPEFNAIAVRSGSVVDLGEIKIRRQRLKSVVVALDSDCAGNPKLVVQARKTPASDESERSIFEPRKEIPCGRFQIVNIPEGHLFVQVFVPNEDQRIYGTREIDVNSKDPIPLTLDKPVLVAGVIEVEGAATGDLPENLRNRAWLRPPFQELLIPPRRSETREFSQQIYAGLTYRLGPPPEEYYVKRAVYNGATLPDVDRFVLSPYASEHALRIVLSRQTAVLQAQIQAEPNRLAQAPLSLVLFRDDLDAARRFTGLISIRAEADGRATKRGLAPGKYRAFVLPTDEVSSLQRPGVLDGYLSKATRLSLDPGQSGMLPLDYR